MDEPSADAHKKQISQQITAAGSSKTADACHIAGKNGKTCSPQKQIHSYGDHGLFWF